MAKYAIRNALNDNLDISGDQVIRNRVNHLKDEVKLTLQAIRNLAGKGIQDALTDPATLATKQLNLGSWMPHN